jgi:hypothetical protein
VLHQTPISFHTTLISKINNENNEKIKANSQNFVAGRISAYIVQGSGEGSRCLWK